MIKAADPCPITPQAACAPACVAPPLPAGGWQPPPITNLIGLRQAHKDFKLKTADPEIKRSPAFGWLLPVLIETDDLLYGRWDWWARSMEAGCLIDSPIPPIDFVDDHNQTRKMLEQCFNAIPNYGSWQGWSSFEYINFFLDWLLYGLGHIGQREPPKEPRGCEGASDRLYQLFQLETMQLWPADYFGDMLAENAHGRANGFYPTPMHVVELMAQMIYGPPTMEARTDRVCDPCVGTGRMLLAASNRSVCLYGQDIDGTLVKCCLVNAALYAPWLYRSFPFLEGPPEPVSSDPPAGETPAEPQVYFQSVGKSSSGIVQQGTLF